MVPVLPGTHLRADVASMPVWRAAAVSAWRPDAVLCGTFAAAATFWRECRVGRIDVACDTTVRRPGFNFERRRIPNELLLWRDETRMTMPALTALDLAVATDGESIDAVLRSKMATIRDLNDALVATPNRRGNRDRRRLLLDSRAEPWSVAERIAHRILHDARISGWRANLPLQLDGQRYFLDIAFRAIRLVIEIDGREFHTLPDVFESDRDRQNALVLDGWVVLRLTYRMLVERPDYVLTTIRSGIRLARRLRALDR
jgi:very-short-patch-repair endonuclease